MLKPDEIKALELRKAGANVSQIAEQLNKELGADRKSFTPQRIKTLIKRALEKLYSPREQQIDLLRQLECARLDSYLMKMAKAINAGDSSAVNTALKVSERRSKIWGLDAPAKVDFEGDLKIIVKCPDASSDTDSDNT